MECLQERASAGESFPQSMGLTRAGARRLKSLASPQQERVRLLDGHEALGVEQEPPLFSGGESQYTVRLDAESRELLWAFLIVFEGAVDEYIRAAQIPAGVECAVNLTWREDGPHLRILHGSLAEVSS